ncbi:MAG: AbrB/MazE/SpoVT family DNA-binding domain-containing protein [Archaeoglobaceae archaeon]|nr:AbrB/MazE/SpoVT family DNA-binding domain-containing protein [Archaeoglobaceae archaeon]MDW8118544.1 AbrB/MazE/SpoVT family DNA-binding domain-containing protein [Archaeoglobaceae archaeon]
MVPSFGDFQKFWEDALKWQREFIESLSSAIKLMSGFSIMSKDLAVFRAKIQAGGRISIPEAEKIALGIKDGDVVKVIIVKEGGERYGDEGVDGSGKGVL